MKVLAGFAAALIAALVVLGILSHDWYGLGAAVPPADKLALDESAAVLTSLEVAEKVEPGEQIDVTGKLNVDTKGFQWSGVATTKRSDKRLVATVRLEAVSRESFGKGEIVSSYSQSNTKQVGTDSAEWSAPLISPRRPGRYRLRVYFCGYNASKMPREYAFKRLIGEADLEVASD